MAALVPISLPLSGRITVAERDGVPVLRLAGEIDAETVAAFQRGPRSSLQVAAVDLGEVTFLSSSAVSFLIRQTQSIRDGGRLPAVCDVSKHAWRVLELLGATRLFAPV